MTGTINRKGKISLYLQAKSIISSANPRITVDKIVTRHAEWISMVCREILSELWP